MKKSVVIASTILLASVGCSASTSMEQPQYLSDWWHQSVNVVGSYHTRFGPQLNNDLYLEYEAFAHKDWFDFYGYIDVPKFFGIGNANDVGIWNKGKGSPFFMEIEPRFSIDKLTNTNLSFGPFKQWYFANNYIYDMGPNNSNRQNTWYMGLGTDIDTHSALNVSMNVYAKYQWQNYSANNENSWDGYRFKIKYMLPLSTLWGGNLSYIGFTNFDWGSDLKNSYGRAGDSITSSHILSLGYDHWHYSLVARYFHHGGQWDDNIALGDIRTNNTGWGYYAIVGYNF